MIESGCEEKKKKRLNIYIQIYKILYIMSIFFLQVCTHKKISNQNLSLSFFQVELCGGGGEISCFTWILNPSYSLIREGGE